MRYFFILNPIAGRGPSASRYEEAIRQVFGAKGITFEIRRTKEKGHARELARQAADQGWPAIVAVGGDGTINETGSALVGTQASLGVIPKGSGNGFSGELGLPRHPMRACEMLLRSRAVKMDVGQVNGRYFLNLAGVGLDAEVGHAFNAPGRSRRGLLPYFYLTLKKMTSFRPSEVEIITPDIRLSCRPLLIVVANGKEYGAGAKIAPKAQINDGIFHITVAHAMPLWKILPAIPHLFSGTLDQRPGIQTLKASSVTLRMSRPVPYHLDGEPFQDGSSLTFELKPLALNILVPEGYCSSPQ